MNRGYPVCVSRAAMMISFSSRSLYSLVVHSRIVLETLSFRSTRSWALATVFVKVANGRFWLGAIGLDLSFENGKLPISACHVLLYSKH